MIPLLVIATVALFAMGKKSSAGSSSTSPSVGTPPTEDLSGRGAGAAVDRTREPRPTPQSDTSVRPDLFVPGTPVRPTRRRNPR